MIAFVLIAYAVCAYGFCNMLIFARGPFGIFEKWRNFTHSISDGLGELFTCPMCLSTWCGIFFSVINTLCVPSVAFTPFNIIFGVGNCVWLTILMDMGFTSGIVWLLHQLEEMMERVGNYEEVVDGEDIKADIEKDDGLK